MTRRSVLGLLGLPLAAQDEAPPLANTPAWETGKAKNGQCSVCGRQSQDHDQGVLMVHEDETKSPLWINRCAKCNTAVWEDLEEKPNPRKAA